MLRNRRVVVEIPRFPLTVTRLFLKEKKREGCNLCRSMVPLSKKERMGKKESLQKTITNLFTNTQNQDDEGNERLQET